MNNEVNNFSLKNHYIASYIAVIHTLAVSLNSPTIQKCSQNSKTFYLTNLQT